MLRSEILTNRRKWIDFLKKPGRKKTTGSLDNGDGQRYCLGHGCYVLGIVKNGDSFSGWSYGEEEGFYVAPVELIELVGLYGSSGDAIDSDVSLVAMNDSQDVSPQGIGKYLESVIEGGPETPWKALSTYPETKNVGERQNENCQEAKTTNCSSEGDESAASSR